MLTEKREELIQTAQLIRHGTPQERVEASLKREDLESSEEDELNQWLRQRSIDLAFGGEFHLIQWPQKDSPQILSSSATDTKRGSKLVHPGAMPRKQKAWASELLRYEGAFWLWAYAPLENQPNLAIAVESNQTPFFYRLLSHALHYLLLVLGFGLLSVLAFFVGARRSKQTEVFSEKAYRYLFEKTQDGILLLDSSWKIQNLNSAAIKAFKLNSKEKLRGQPLESLHSKELSLFPLSISKEELRVRREKKENFQCKMKLVVGENNICINYLDLKFVPIENHWLVVFRDITSDLVKEQELIQFDDTHLEAQQFLMDPLTKILNRNYLDSFLKDEQWDWLKLEKCSLLMIDIDNFKEINDTKGHLWGDEVLKSMASYLKDYFRHSDKIIRYGGDEFLILLPKTQIETATRIANNLLVALAQEKRKYLSGVQISIGVAELDPEESADDWINRADAALYTAKNYGKARVEAQRSNELEILG